MNVGILTHTWVLPACVVEKDVLLVPGLVQHVLTFLLLCIDIGKGFSHCHRALAP
jgi:hypothetical protein